MPESPPGSHFVQTGSASASRIIGALPVSQESDVG